jgi:prophage antirepressor-like protein
MAAANLPTVTPAPMTFAFDHAVNIRALVINQDPWFVAKDVASALGYTNPPKAVRDHCKRAKSLRMLGRTDRSPYTNQQLSLDPQTKLIPEPDLYRLIIRSKLPAAERFESWVFEEVLPQIRKTGAYLPQAESPGATITPEQLKRLKRGVHLAANCYHMRRSAMQAIYRALHKRFGVRGLENLLKSQFDDAIDCLKRVFSTSTEFRRGVIEKEAPHIDGLMAAFEHPDAGPLDAEIWAEARDIDKQDEADLAGFLLG